MKQKTDCIL